MAEKPAQERTERATPRRLQQAREKGQLARSRELSTMIVLLAAAGGLFLAGGSIIGGLLEVMTASFQMPRDELLDPLATVFKLEKAMADAIGALLPFLVIVTLAAIAGPLLMGGWNFSTQAIAFKWDKLDPIKGLGRVFSARGLIELLKALAKFSIVLAVALTFLWFNVDAILGLGGQDVNDALMNAGEILLMAFLLLSASMIVIAAVDVPFQLWDHQRQLRMTRQELRDEFKETDGNPEMKRKVREVRQELAQRRMMQELPRADVVITNPTHYAVALRYDQDRMSAPVVVAKGRDLVALQIRTVALEHGIPIVSAPPLARAIYHSTELQQRIPTGLFVAVAQILAYAYQLRRKPRQRRAGNRSFNDLPIPEELRVD
ncbi:MAG: flagellar biosynthesis protein FlhB [Gammaproteobacteria bacterium]|jgi:flagellar biosynthetic protein FlhB|nr:flagellar biosynthesis protein FlhB [Gammaproteobacteria bacterium]